MKGPNEGDESWRLAKFKEIHEPEKKIYQEYFFDKDRNINRDIPAFDTVISFEAVDSKTKITINS